MSAELIRAAGALDLVERWMTPFLRVSTACPRRKLLEEFLAPFLAARVPVTVQLMGTQAQPMAEAAQRFLELGAAGINLNFGCPSRQVTSGGAGGGALRDPDSAAKLVAQLRAALPDAPLGVKLRTGWSSPDEQEQLIPRLAAAGADALFVHFRTVSEGYLPTPGREARLRRSIALAGSVPVIVNGDLATGEEAHALCRDTGGAGVMAARGWLHDPCLLQRIAGKPGLPDPETARRTLFRAVIANGFKVCRAIELSNFLWGKAANPYFEQLKRLPATSRFSE